MPLVHAPRRTAVLWTKVRRRPSSTTRIGVVRIIARGRARRGGVFGHAGRFAQLAGDASRPSVSWMVAAGEPVPYSPTNLRQTNGQRGGPGSRRYGSDGPSACGGQGMRDRHTQFSAAADSGSNEDRWRNGWGESLSTRVAAVRSNRRNRYATGALSLLSARSDATCPPCSSCPIFAVTLDAEHPVLVLKATAGIAWLVFAYSLLCAMPGNSSNLWIERGPVRPRRRSSWGSAADRLTWPSWRCPAGSLSAWRTCRRHRFGRSGTVNHRSCCPRCSCCRPTAIAAGLRVLERRRHRRHAEWVRILKRWRPRSLRPRCRGLSTTRWGIHACAELVLRGGLPVTGRLVLCRMDREHRLPQTPRTTSRAPLAAIMNSPGSVRCGCPTRCRRSGWSLVDRLRVRRLRRPGKAYVAWSLSRRESWAQQACMWIGAIISGCSPSGSARSRRWSPRICT